MHAEEVHIHPALVVLLNSNSKSLRDARHPMVIDLLILLGICEGKLYCLVL